MKKSALIIFFVLMFVFTPLTVQAATINVSIPLEQREYPASKEIAIPININSSDAFNAFTVTVEFENLEFVKANYDQSWTAIEGPTHNGNSVTFTAALLGKEKYKIGSFDTVTLIMKTPAQGNFTLKGSGTVALTDADANQISKSLEPVSFAVTDDLVKSTMFSIENSQSMVFKILRIAIPVLIVVVVIWLIRMKKLRPGRKSTYQ